MNHAWLGAFAAAHFAGYQPDTAGAAMAGATIKGQVNTVSQCRIQQQLAPARRKAFPIDSNLVTSRHFMILEASRIGQVRLAAPPHSIGNAASEVFGNRSLGFVRQQKCPEFASDHRPMLRLDGP